MCAIVELMLRVGHTVDLEDHCIVSLTEIELVICGPLDCVDEVISEAIDCRLRKKSVSRFKTAVMVDFCNHGVS